MGGARPKTTVEDGNRLWVGKFPEKATVGTSREWSTRRSNWHIAVESTRAIPTWNPWAARTY